MNAMVDNITDNMVKNYASSLKPCSGVSRSSKPTFSISENQRCRSAGDISVFVFSCPDSGISLVFNLKFQPSMSQAVDTLSFEMEQS